LFAAQIFLPKTQREPKKPANNFTAAIDDAFLFMTRTYDDDVSNQIVDEIKQFIQECPPGSHALEQMKQQRKDLYAWICKKNKSLKDKETCINFHGQCQIFLPDRENFLRALELHLNSNIATRVHTEDTLKDPYYQIGYQHYIKGMSGVIGKPIIRCPIGNGHKQCNAPLSLDPSNLVALNNLIQQITQDNPDLINLAQRCLRNIERHVQSRFGTARKYPVCPACDHQNINRPDVFDNIDKGTNLTEIKYPTDITCEQCHLRFCADCKGDHFTQGLPICRGMSHNNAVLHIQEMNIYEPTEIQNLAKELMKCSACEAVFFKTEDSCQVVRCNCARYICFGCHNIRTNHPDPTWAQDDQRRHFCPVVLLFEPNHYTKDELNAYLASSEDYMWQVFDDGSAEYAIYMRNPVWRHCDNTQVERKLVMKCDATMILIPH
jgi:hypothetical protein